MVRAKLESEDRCLATGKYRYKSKSEANFCKPEGWRSYYCNYCHSWHHTKQPKDPGRSKRA